MQSSRNAADDGTDSTVPTQYTPDAEQWDGDWDGRDRRRQDRRSRPTRLFRNRFEPHRRVHGRRGADHSNYVDRYSKRDVALLLTVFLLNVADAFFTMLWLERGGREANPVMDFFLDIGPSAFLIQKCLVVGAWLLLLLVHKNFRFARLGLYASLVVYAVLMVIHFGLVAFGVEPAREDREAQPRAISTSITSRSSATSGSADPAVHVMPGHESRPSSIGTTGSTRIAREPSETASNPIPVRRSIS